MTNFRSCLCEHSSDNSEITVRTRRGEAGMTFPIEFDNLSVETASMIAARKFYAARGEQIEPLHQERQHRLERNGTYVVRVRF